MTIEQRGIGLTDDERRRLTDFVTRLGRQAAARKLGVSDDTLARAAAGFTIHRGTATHLRVRLAEGADE